MLVMLTLQEVINDIEESKKKRDAAGMMSDVNKEIFKQMTEALHKSKTKGQGEAQFPIVTQKIKLWTTI